MSFSITFIPLVANNNAQVSTEATVLDEKGNVFWTELVVVDVTETTTLEQVQQSIRDKTSGFARRVEAIRKAREFEGVIPKL